MVGQDLRTMSLTCRSPITRSFRGFTPMFRGWRCNAGGSYLVSNDADTNVHYYMMVFCLEGFWVLYTYTPKKKSTLFLPSPKKQMAELFHGLVVFLPSHRSRNHLRKNYQTERRSSDPGSPTERHAPERRGSAASEMPGARPSTEGHSRWGWGSLIWLDMSSIPFGTIWLRNSGC